MRPTLLIGTLAVLVVLTSPPAVPAPSSVASSVGVSTAVLGPTTARSTATLTMEGDAMQAVNRARTRSGCPALKVTGSLRIAARRHSARMARRGSLVHRLAGEPTLSRRVSDAGYTGATMLGEVIALGPTSGSSAVRMWLASSLHRAILLDCRFRHFGAGAVRGGNGRYWWTVDLGRK